MKPCSDDGPKGPTYHPDGYNWTLGEMRAAMRSTGCEFRLWYDTEGRLTVVAAPGSPGAYFHTLDRSKPLKEALEQAGIS